LILGSGFLLLLDLLVSLLLLLKNSLVLLFGLLCGDFLVNCLLLLVLGLLLNLLSLLLFLLFNAFGLSLGLLCLLVGLGLDLLLVRLELLLVILLLLFEFVLLRLDLGVADGLKGYGCLALVDGSASASGVHACGLDTSGSRDGKGFVSLVDDTETFVSEAVLQFLEDLGHVGWVTRGLDAVEAIVSRQSHMVIIFLSDCGTLHIWNDHRCCSVGHDWSGDHVNLTERVVVHIGSELVDLDCLR